MHAVGRRALTARPSTRRKFHYLTLSTTAGACIPLRRFQTAARLAKQPTGDDASAGGRRPDSDKPDAATRTSHEAARRAAILSDEAPRRSRARVSRMRSARSRPPDNMPPLKFPDSFLSDNVLLTQSDTDLSAFREFNHKSILDWTDTQLNMANILLLDYSIYSPESFGYNSDQALMAAFEAVAWNTTLVDEVRAGAPDEQQISAIARRTFYVVHLLTILTYKYSSSLLFSSTPEPKAVKAIEASSRREDLDNKKGQEDLAEVTGREKTGKAAVKEEVQDQEDKQKERQQYRAVDTRRHQTGVRGKMKMDTTTESVTDISKPLLIPLPPPHYPSEQDFVNLPALLATLAVTHASCQAKPHHYKADVMLKLMMTDLINQTTPPHHLVPWLDFWNYHELKLHLLGELMEPPRPLSSSRQTEIKRPVTLVTIPNYNGKVFGRATVSALASAVDADLVSLDARSISILVGEYLGQDWTISRGPISMLGFRAAMLNGRLGTDPDIALPERMDDGLSEDSESNRSHGRDMELDDETPLGRELQKIREDAGEYVLDSMDAWENLKINAALEHIIQAARVKARGGQDKADSSPSQLRRLLIHVDDWVELSMTLEGSLLLGRLRNIVDRQWLAGTPIAIVGTSSYNRDTASDHFLSCLTDLADEECHTSLQPIDTRRKSLWSSLGPSDLALVDHQGMRSDIDAFTIFSTIGKFSQNWFSHPDGSFSVFDFAWQKRHGTARLAEPDYETLETLEHADCVDETVQNVRHVLDRTLPEAISKDFLLSRDFAQHLVGDRGTDALDEEGAKETLSPDQDKGHVLKMLSDSILPYNVIYDIAQRLRVDWAMSKYKSDPSEGHKTLLNMLSRRANWQKLEAVPAVTTANDDSRPQSGESEPVSESDQRPKQKGATVRAKIAGTEELNDRETRLLSGLIKSDEIRATFDDIHIAPEIIASLKLLTSVSLIRPDALAYGVLAKEKMSGCLLYGPPGTGKSLLAKALAKTSNANFLEVSGATIEEMYVGESEKNVRAIFSLARKKKPMVIFIDEADALLGSRTGVRQRNRRETLNQLLREWDGVTDTSAFVMVATNRPYDLDEAVLRRLPRRILIDLPTEPDRGAILRIMLRDECLEPTVSVDEIARRTQYYSGSDLKNVVVAAALAAVAEENEAAARYEGPDPYQYPKRRILRVDHFEKALKEVSASIAEGSETLKSLRKFDEMFGMESKKTAKSVGFGVVAAGAYEGDGRVRKTIASHSHRGNRG